MTYALRFRPEVVTDLEHAAGPSRLSNSLFPAKGVRQRRRVGTGLRFNRRLLDLGDRLGGFHIRPGGNGSDGR